MRRFKLKIKLLTLATAGFAFCFPAMADSFAAGTGSLGTSHTFLVNGKSITATGYSSAGVSGNLYFKNGGGDETGLGLAGMTANEIGGTGFIQFGLGSFLAGASGATQLTLGSVEAGESYNVYGSNVAGSKGALLGGGGAANTTFTLPATTYQYISVGAPSGNVLVQGIQTTDSVSVPEPSAIFLLCTGLIAMLGAAALLRR